MSDRGESLPGPREEDELPSSAVGHEILRASLESLRRFAASQDALARSLERERAIGWWRTALLGLAVLAIVGFLVWSGWQLQEQGRALQESLQTASLSGEAAATEAALRTELERVTARVRELEQGAAAVDKAAPSPVSAWQPEQPSGRPGGPRVEETKPGKVEDWKEGLLRGLERGAGYRAVLEPAGANDKKADNDRAVPTDSGVDEAEHRQLASAVNRLFQDSGMEWLTFVEGRVDPKRQGLTQVVLASAGVGGAPAGTIQAGFMRLVRNPVTGEARWLCDEATSTQGGVRVEYPARRLVLDIPGRLPVEWIREPLLGLVQDPRAEEMHDSPLSLRDTYNQVLQEVEEVPVRFRSIERRVGGSLRNVVVEWWEVGAAGDLRELHIDEAWWELDESRASLTLKCEGGSLRVGESLRPFFRGHYQLPLRNVNVEAWRPLPCVRRIHGGSGPAAATEASGGGP